MWFGRIDESNTQATPGIYHDAEWGSFTWQTGIWNSPWVWVSYTLFCPLFPLNRGKSGLNMLAVNFHPRVRILVDYLSEQYRTLWYFFSDKPSASTLADLLCPTSIKWQTSLMKALHIAINILIKSICSNQSKEKPISLSGKYRFFTTRTDV